MNELQEKLLSIAKEYIRVCELLKLSWFAYGGTCLGAIRHNGFIPWDDDMDFCMPRKDYDIFLKESSKYLDKKYLLQCFENDHNYPYTFAKIRDTKTTMIDSIECNFNINHGCWIDIFVLDGLPNSDIKIRRIATRKKILYRPRYHFKYYNWKWYHLPYILLLFVLLPTRNIAYKRDKNQLIKYDFDKSLLIWDNWYYLYHKNKFYKIQKKPFESYKDIKFEDTTFRVPKDYDDYLTEVYGDWRTPPPENERKPTHGIKILDLNKGEFD